MRASELEESAADELKRELPSLKKTDYDTIDRLMQRISKRHKITGKKLHDLFVSKYGQTPDHWIKKYKNKLKEESNTVFVLHINGIPSTKYFDKSEAVRDLAYLKTQFPKHQLEIKPLDPSKPNAYGLIGEGNPSLPAIKNPTKEYVILGDNKPLIKFENIDDANTVLRSLRSKYPEVRYKLILKDQHGKVYEDSIKPVNQEEQIQHFIKWAYKIVNLQEPHPKFTFSDDTEEAQQGHHTGRHSHNGTNSEIWVYTGNRNLVDILRTVFHEIVHEKQMQLNMIGPNDSYPGSPIEAMADMLAGKYIKIYGKKHPEIFQ